MKADMYSAERLSEAFSLAGRFKAELYALTKEEGGRHTPFFSNYRPQFFFRTADVTGASWTLARTLDAVFGALRRPTWMLFKLVSCLWQMMRQHCQHRRRMGGLKSV